MKVSVAVLFVLCVMWPLGFVIMSSKRSVMEKGTEMQTVKLSPPWIGYARRLRMLFGKDPAVTVLYDDDATEVKVLVNGPAKADAIEKLLPHEVEFGKVSLKVTVIPANEAETTEVLLRRAFDGNPIVSGITSGGDMDPMGARPYVSFLPVVAQFFDDDLSDPNGYTSMLYEDVAREVFRDNVPASFSTARRDGGEVWP